MTYRILWLFGLVAFFLPIGSVAAPPAGAAPADAATPRVTLEWRDSSRYTDARSPTINQERFDLSLRASFRRFFEELARRYLPAGATLEVAIDDLDLAGEVAFSPAVAQVRSYSRLLPPRMVLSYELRDRDGELLVSEQGTELVGRADRIPRRTLTEPYPYERALVEDWFRDELASAPDS